MIFITSPAKTLDFSSDWSTTINPTEPDLEKDAKFLVNKISELSKEELQKFLDVSEKLADLNYKRYQRWDHTSSKPAILAYKGDIYQQFEASSFKREEEEYIQTHLRILSGLYGILCPYDKIKPYRLEMKTKLTKLNNLRVKDLYDYWNDSLTQHLNAYLENFEKKDRAVINLASNEYVRAINKERIEGDWIDIEFRQIKNGEEKNYGIYAKKARGFMINWMIQNQVTHISQLEKFDIEGYSFSSIEEGKYYFSKKI